MACCSLFTCLLSVTKLGLSPIIILKSVPHSGSWMTVIDNQRKAGEGSRDDSLTLIRRKAGEGPSRVEEQEEETANAIGKERDDVDVEALNLGKIPPRRVALTPWWLTQCQRSWYRVPAHVATI